MLRSRPGELPSATDAKRTEPADKSQSLTMNDQLSEDWKQKDQAEVQASLDRLLEEYRPRLKRMVGVRLDPRVRGRVDDSDILQEAYMEAARRIDDYLSDPPMPFFLWLRWITGERIKLCHRTHLGASKRDANRDCLLGELGLQASTQSLALQLLGDAVSPSKKAMEDELLVCVEQVMADLPPVDREVLVLRHFEQLTNQETAQVLGLNASAASSRYFRALGKLRQALAKVPGFFG